MEANALKSLLTISEISLSYRPGVKPSERPQLRHAGDVYDLLLGFWNLDKIQLCEQFCVVLLNNRKRVLGIIELSSGGFTGVVADTRMIFGTALKACACSIVVAHNHPGGDTEPSDADITITKRLAEAGKLLEIKLDDHLIITTEGYYSFAEQGFL